MFDLSDKVFIITGAAGGLGRDVAQAFHAAGARLALVDHNEERIQALIADLGGTDQNSLAVMADLTDEDSVNQMAARAVEHFGHIDGLVNIAGGYRAGTPLHETPVDTWDFLMNLNARTVFLACRAVIPHLLSNGYGKIVSVSARIGLAGEAKAGPYSVSKSAVIRLTESMAAELQGTGINVNCVLPRIIDTPANRSAMPKADHDKWPKPEELANVLLFLCSDLSAVVHGAAIPVYGAR